MDDVTRKMSRGIGLLTLRIGAGLLMMTHGWGKVQKIVEGDWKFGDPIGLGPHLSLIATAGAEFVLAGMVVIGLATRLSAAPIVFTMMVAAFVVHANDGWARQEFPILFALMFLVITLTGPGRFSADHVLWPKIKKRMANRRRERKFKKKHAE